MHFFLDRITVKSTTLVLGKKKFFRSSINSPGYKTLLEEAELELPSIKKEGIYELNVNNPAGPLDPAFDLVQWKGDHFPTVIYHHGNNEKPFKYKAWEKNSFYKIFKPRQGELEANLFNLRAPFHQSFNLYLEKIADLNQFLTMLTTSTRLIQELINFSREKGSSPIIVSGISLGGWVTCLHRAFYNTADAYLPLLGGPRPADIFLDSIYSRLVNPAVSKHREEIETKLNFTGDFSRHQEDNVFPLLALYDQIIRYEVQKDAFKPHPVATINKGHTTGFLAGKAFREHIEKVLVKE